LAEGGSANCPPSIRDGRDGVEVSSSSARETPRERARRAVSKVAMATSGINLVGPEAWEYDVLAVAESGGVSLRHVAFDIFAAEGLVERYGIPEERFKGLLARLELLYSVENPYHCALHAAVRVEPEPAPATRKPATRRRALAHDRLARTNNERPVLSSLSAGSPSS
jgi:hypothetical protein